MHVRSARRANTHSSIFIGSTKARGEFPRDGNRGPGSGRWNDLQRPVYRRQRQHHWRSRFHTALTGYQEILSDPSYSRQIVTLTYPHIGNTGTTPEDLESPTAYAAGLVVRDLPPLASNWRKSEDLPEFLTRHKVVAIAGIDTRKLTRILREKGAQAGCIMAGDKIDAAAAVRLAKKFPGLKGMDLAKVVSTKRVYQWKRGQPVAAGETDR